jgi:hypothetical protein
MALIVEAEPVDDAFVLDQAEDARLGLPACGFGVTVPISVKPKPIFSSASGTSAFLS